MGLGFGLDMRLGDAMAFEGQPVAGVGIGIDDGDVGPDGLDPAIQRYGAADALVADVICNNATLSPRISSPYDGPVPFFWM